MAATTVRRPGVHSKLRDLSNDGGASQVNSDVALRAIDTKANAADSAGHDRTHGSQRNSGTSSSLLTYSQGTQSFSQAMTSRRCDGRAMATFLPFRNAPRNRHGSGIPIHEQDTTELRDTCSGAASWHNTVHQRGRRHRGEGEQRSQLPH